MGYELVGPGVVAAGRYVILTRDDGVSVLDARTGRERWHYLRRDARLGATAVTPHGQLLVVVMSRLGEFANAGQNWLIAAFDLATGQQRWQRSAALPDAPVFAVAADGTVATAAECADLPGAACVDVTAYDAADGRLWWRWRAWACEPGSVVAGAAAIAAVVSPPGSLGCRSDSVAVVPAATGPRPPRGGSAAAPRRVGLRSLPGAAPDVTGTFAIAAPGGFLVAFPQAPPRGRGDDRWAVARVSTDGSLQGRPVVVGCPVQAAVQQGTVQQAATLEAGSVVACASVARSGPGGWAVAARGVDAASGAVIWRRALRFASQPSVSASGGVFYAATEPPGADDGPWQTTAIRADDGARIGQAAGFEAAASGGVVIFVQPAGVRTTVTAFG